MHLLMAGHQLYLQLLEEEKQLLNKKKQVQLLLGLLLILELL